MASQKDTHETFCDAGIDTFCDRLRLSPSHLVRKIPQVSIWLDRVEMAGELTKGFPENDPESKFVFQCLLLSREVILVFSVRHLSCKFLKQ